MIDQLVFNYMNKLLSNTAMLGDCLNIGLGYGHSARLMLQSRLVNRVVSLEVDQTVIDDYRTRFPANEVLEVRHTIVQGDAANPAPGLVQALNPPFDFIYCDIQYDNSEATFDALKNVLTAAKNGILKQNGFLLLENHGDNYNFREFMVWVNQYYTVTTTRQALTFNGRGWAAPMRVLRIK